MVAWLILTGILGLVVGALLALPVLVSGFLSRSQWTSSRAMMLCVAALLVGYLAAISYGAYGLTEGSYRDSVAPDSRLPTATQVDIQTHREAVVREIALRMLFLGFAPETQCFSGQAEACTLVDTIDQSGWEPWSVKLWGAFHFTSIWAGVVAAMLMAAALGVRSFLVRKREGTSRAAG